MVFQWVEVLHLGLLQYTWVWKIERVPPRLEVLEEKVFDFMWHGNIIPKLINKQNVPFHRPTENKIYTKTSNWTRMHSSRMRTVRSSSLLGGGGVSAQGGICPEGGVSLGVVVVYSSPLWTDSHLWKHNLSATTVADGKKKKKLSEGTSLLASGEGGGGGLGRGWRTLACTFLWHTGKFYAEN